MQDSIRTDLSAGPGGEGADSGPLAFTPSLSPTPSRRELNNRAAVTGVFSRVTALDLYAHVVSLLVFAMSYPVDSRSPARRPASSSHWLQSPFQNLEALANMSPDSNLSMSSFCFSSPGRFSPGHVPYVSTATPGINYRMSPETPFTSGMAKELGDELASPLFSPVLFSPYEASARHGHSKIGSANSKLSLVHDFHDVKHSDSPHPDIFSSLSNTGIL